MSWWTWVAILVIIFGLRSLRQQTYFAKFFKAIGRLYDTTESIFVTIFIYLFGQVFGGLLIYSALMAGGWSQDRINAWIANTSLGQFIIILVIEALSIALLSFFMRHKKLTWATIGLKGAPKLRDLGHVLGGYVVYLVAYISLIGLVSRLIPSLNLNQEQQIGFENVTRSQLPLVFMSLVILPPIVEEILMRGYLFTSLKEKFPKKAAVIITSVLFASAHLQAGSGAPLLWVAAIDTFVLSVILIELKERTGGRLWAPIGLHATKNLVAFLSLFVFHIAK